MTGNRIMRQRVGVIAMIVMMVDVLEQTPDMFAQSVIQDQCRLVFRQPHAFRLSKHIRHPTVINLLLKPAVC